MSDANSLVMTMYDSAAGTDIRGAFRMLDAQRREFADSRLRSSPYHVIVSTVSDGMPALRSRTVDERLVYGFGSGDVVFGSFAFCKSFSDTLRCNAPLPLDVMPASVWALQRMRHLDDLVLKLAAINTELALTNIEYKA